MSYSFYKILHLSAMVAVIVSLASQFALQMSSAGIEKSLRRFFGIFHGVGLLLGLTGGFGLLARTQAGFPGWIILKIGLWVYLGAAIAIARRKPNLAKVGLYSLVVVFGLAVYLVQYRPF
ncbi:MAG: hypothetical protein AB7T49_20465 [Oligoflexales bacterium]